MRFGWPRSSLVRHTHKTFPHRNLLVDRKTRKLRVKSRNSAVEPADFSETRVIVFRRNWKSLLEKSKNTGFSGGEVGGIGFSENSNSVKVLGWRDSLQMRHGTSSRISSLFPRSFRELQIRGISVIFCAPILSLSLAVQTSRLAHSILNINTYTRDESPT